MVDINCPQCSSLNIVIKYDGPIRLDGVGREQTSDFKVHYCNECHLHFLHPLPINIDNFYQSSKYRDNYDGGVDVDSIQAKYDQEQSLRIEKIGLENLRNKTVADFGCGAGLLLDAVQGFTSKTIAIEPTESFHRHLEESGHIVFSYIGDMKKKYSELDVALCFDTIEQIAEPQAFISDIYDSLKDGGILYLSMPNHNDILMQMFPEYFCQFHYTFAHVNYYDYHSATWLLKKCGFKIEVASYLHKYNIYNLLNWAQHGKPGVLEFDKNIVDTSFDKSFSNEVERLGVASHLYFKCTK